MNKFITALFIAGLTIFSTSYAQTEVKKEEPKAAAKAEAKPAAKAEVKPAAKAEVKPAAKAEVKPAAKVEEVKK